MACSSAFTRHSLSQDQQKNGAYELQGDTQGRKRVPTSRVNSASCFSEMTVSFYFSSHVKLEEKWEKSIENRKNAMGEIFNSVDVCLDFKRRRGHKLQDRVPSIIEQSLVM